MRSCTVCQSNEREQIDRMLVDNAPYRAVARQFKLSKDAIRRHKESHLPMVLMRSKEAQELSHGDTLWQQMTQLNAKTQKILARAERAGNHDIELKAIAESRKNLELQGKLMGELGKQKPPTVHKALHLHNVPLSDLIQLADTGRLPDAEDQETENKHLIERNSQP
jgi:cytochrome c556